MTIKLSQNNIIQYLLDTSLCREKEVDLVKIVFQPSINSILLIVFFSSSHQLFIQQNPKLSSTSNYKNYINNELKIHSFLNSCHDLTYTASLSYEIVHFDESNSILIYKAPNGHTTIENYYRKKNNFSLEVSRILGTTLAIFHQETFKSQTCNNYFNTIIQGEYQYRFPHPKHILEKPTPESLNEDLPPEGLKFLGLYQNSESFRRAVTELVATHKHYCLTLNNFKLNNILIPIDSEPKLSTYRELNPAIKIVNWNSCSWGDPAFDLGTTISSYLLIWLQSVPASSSLSLNQSLKLASVPFNVIQPLINSFVCSYLSEFPAILEDYPDFLIRVIQFTGLSLTYSLLLQIQSFVSFDNQCVYILQIAKNLLCKPKDSVKSILGIADLELVR